MFIGIGLSITRLIGLITGAVSALMWDADDSTLMWNGDDSTLMWGAVPGVSPNMWGVAGDNMWSATDSDLMWTAI